MKKIILILAALMSQANVASAATCRAMVTGPNGIVMAPALLIQEKEPNFFGLEQQNRLFIVHEVGGVLKLNIINKDTKQTIYFDDEQIMITESDRKLVTLACKNDSDLSCQASIVDVVSKTIPFPPTALVVNPSDKDIRIVVSTPYGFVVNSSDGRVRYNVQNKSTGQGIVAEQKRLTIIEGDDQIVSLICK